MAKVRKYMDVHDVLLRTSYYGPQTIGSSFGPGGVDQEPPIHHCSSDEYDLNAF